MAEAVRFAAADDIQAIMALEQGAIAHPWPEEDLRRVADICRRNDVGEASVGNLVVRADRRGRGLGTKLVEALIAELLRRGAEVIFLEVEDTNAPAIAVYTRCGFTEYNRRRDYYGAGRDARLMKRAVAGA